MDRDPGVFELLRQQLDAMHERQRSGGGLADPSFWQAAAQSPPVLSEPAALLAQEVTPQDVTAQRSRARSRMTAPGSRPVRRGSGPWSAVPLERLKTLTGWSSPGSAGPMTT